MILIEVVNVGLCMNKCPCLQVLEYMFILVDFIHLTVLTTNKHDRVAVR